LSGEIGAKIRRTIAASSGKISNLPGCPSTAR
jgi:hypothetical protein